MSDEEIKAVWKRLDKLETKIDTLSRFVFVGCGIVSTLTVVVPLLLR